MSGFALVAALAPTPAADPAAVLAPLIDAANAETTGVYLATRDSGADASRRFWAHARAVGVGLASPAGFAATLPSAAATAIALRWGLRGPNHSFCGGPDASAGALEAALADLADGSVRRALLVRLDGATVAAVALTAGATIPDHHDLDHHDDPIIRLSHSGAGGHQKGNDHV